MKILNLENNFSHELASKEAALTLLKDGIIVYPTDTIYGLGANALNPVAIDKIFKIKKRPPQKPIPIIVSSIEMAKAIAFVDRDKERILRELWPGPYTFVFSKKSIMPKELTAGEKTVAIRLPANDFCQSLLADFEGPITATSANVSGEETASTARQIAERFEKEKHQPDLVVDAGFLPEQNPSTIIDLTAEVPTILRVNPTTKDKLLEILKSLS